MPGTSVLWFLRKPSQQVVHDFLARQRREPFSYPEVGQSRSGTPAGYDLDHNRVRLGAGLTVYEAACAALRRWEMFPRPWTQIEPADTPIEQGNVVAMVAHALGVWWLNACRIVYVLDEAEPVRRFGFAYGTLTGHVERGEERFSVELLADGSVWYDVRAFSRPRFWPVRLAYPLARRLQRRFVRGIAGRDEKGGGEDSMISWLDSRVRALAGGILWAFALIALHPSPFEVAWAKALLLLGPLVLVPLGLFLVHLDEKDRIAVRLRRIVDVVQFPAALLFGVAYLLPQGLPAAGLALPWLVTTGLIALFGLWRLRRGSRSLSEVCVDAGLIYLAIGGAWAVSDRLGFRPLDFDPVIVLLTAIHFHYAGFALPLVTGLAARRLDGGTARLAAAGVIAGVPLVAIGITSTQLKAGPLIESLAAWVLAAAGILTASLHLRLAFAPGRPAVRCLWTVAAVSLAGSMVLAAMYGSRFYIALSWLDIPWMRAFHGTANALGFGLAGLLAWVMAKKFDVERM